MRTGSSLLGVTALALTLAASLPACKGGEAGYGPGQPPGQGGHGGTGGGDDDDTADAGTVIGADGGIANGVNGFVCTVANVTLPGNCARLHLADLSVKLITLDNVEIDETRTDEDGAFAFEHPNGVLEVFVVVDDPAFTPTYHRSAERVGIRAGQSSDVTMQLITESYFDDIMTASGQAPLVQNGVVFLRLLDGDMPVAGAVIGELSGQDAYYDGPGDSSHFTLTNPTTDKGFAAWFNVMPQGAASVTYNVTIAGGAPTPHVGYSFANAVTFLSDVI